MRKLIYVLILFLNSNCFSQTAWKTSYTAASTIQDMFFLNGNTGWLTGENGFVAKTTNGGENWVVQTTPLSDHRNTAITFYDENTGWMTATPPGGESSNNYSYLLYTINGGEFWYQVPQNSISVWVREISAVNSTTVIFTSGIGYFWGFGYTYIGEIIKTSNSGLNLSRYHFNDSSDCFFYKHQFVNENTGWAHYSRYSNEGHALIRTSNQGSSWYAVNIDGSMYVKYISDISFLNENTGYIIVKEQDNSLKVKKTFNKGETWANTLTTPPLHILGNIFFISEQTGWVTGSNGIISQTTNGGNSWNSATFASPQGADKMKFINSLTGYIVKGNTLYKTTTGGITSVNPNGSSVPDKFSLSQNYPNPFNPQTRINYELPITNYVSIKVYDVLGNEIATLVNEKQNAGSYSVDFNAGSLPSGIYFYKLVTEKFSETKKMILVK